MSVRISTFFVPCAMPPARNPRNASPIATQIVGSAIPTPWSTIATSAAAPRSARSLRATTIAPSTIPIGQALSHAPNPASLRCRTSFAKNTSAAADAVMKSAAVEPA
jgi:hypothetical protein